MDYQINSDTLIENAKIDVYDLHIIYEAGKPSITKVSVNISDQNDGVTVELDGADIPSTTQYNALVVWAKNELKPYEV